MESPPLFLKRSPARQVLVVGDRVEKRFRHPKLLSRLWDRSRARREFATLTRLAEAGIPVPHPRKVGRGPEGWTVEMDWLREARSLSDWLEEPSRPFDEARLGRELGRLLARVHRLGLDHPDLHAGNVLVEPSGRVWAVDFHKAELRRVDPKVWTRDLVALASSVRERTTARFRARVYWAWRRELFADGEAFAPANGHAREIEGEARRHRFAVAYARRLRWTRESSSCRVSAHGGAPVYLRSELSEEHLGRLASQLRDGPTSGAAAGAPTAVANSVTVDGSDLVRVAGPREVVLDLWFGAARMEEHRLGARPHALFDGARPCAFLEAQRINVDGEGMAGEFLEKLEHRGVLGLTRADCLGGKWRALGSAALGIPTRSSQS